MPAVQPEFDSWEKQAFFFSPYDVHGRSRHFNFHHVMYIGPACCQVGTGISLSGNKVAGV